MLLNFKKDFPINFYSKNPAENALFQAVTNNNLNKVKEMIESSTNINCRADLNTDWTPLLIAFYLSRKEIFIFLLENGANKDAKLKDDRGLEDLKTATNIDFLELLQPKNEEVNYEK